MAGGHSFKLRWATIYPLIGIVILWQQTFVASEAQPWLVLPALALMGFQIPINYVKALNALQGNGNGGKSNGNGDGKPRPNEGRVDVDR